MDKPSYGIVTQVAGSIDAVQPHVVAALSAEGFGILSEIDVAATLKKKLGREIRPYRILGACNPPLASRAVDAEPHVGLLLPCNVLLQEMEPGVTVVSALDPDAMFGMIEGDGLASVAKEASASLRRALAALTA
ncbi:MAG: hypothetical protein ACI8PZ_004825 [Myxococcota bacterium]|jgi:uncharacterized protein (DUF302 family)